MKQIISIFIMTLMFSMVAYAGQWKQDETGWRYQNDDGVYKIGWHQDVDGKWYYFDNQTTYMLTNTTTPDGYVVASDGGWIEGSATGIVNDNGYDNRVELEVTAYENGPRMIGKLGYSLPVVVHYNNEYDMGNGNKMTVSGLEISKDGVLYIKFQMNKDAFLYEFKAVGKYVLEDGTYVENDTKTWNAHFEEKDEFSATIIRYPAGVKSKPVSAEIYIEMIE